MRSGLPPRSEGDQQPVVDKPKATAAQPTLSGPMEGVYKFVDDQGVIHYVDSIEKVPAKYRKRAHHPSGGALTIIPASSIDDLLEKYDLADKKFGAPQKKRKRKKVKQHGQVVVYTTSWCPACKRALKYLKKRGVVFTEKDVEGSRSNLEEMLGKSAGARGVPVIDIYGKIVRGFNRKAIDRALDR